MTTTGEQWQNVDGTLLDVHDDGTGVTYRPTTRAGWRELTRPPLGETA